MLHVSNNTIIHFGLRTHTISHSWGPEEPPTPREDEYHLGCLLTIQTLGPHQDLRVRCPARTLPFICHLTGLNTYQCFILFFQWILTGIEIMTEFENKYIHDE